MLENDRIRPEVGRVARNPVRVKAEHVGQAHDVQVKVEGRQHIAPAEDFDAPESFMLDFAFDKPPQSGMNLDQDTAA